MAKINVILSQLRSHLIITTERRLAVTSNQVFYQILLFKSLRSIDEFKQDFQTFLFFFSFLFFSLSLLKYLSTSIYINHDRISFVFRTIRKAFVFFSSGIDLRIIMIIFSKL